MAKPPLRVLLGISGGIAAYKAAPLVRRLRESGCEVRCCLTRAAARFVTPLTLEILSGYAVHAEEYLEANGSGEELHITTAEWADVLCVAPATTHTLARLALGLGDDFLTTTALAFDGQLVLAPAMHQAMWLRSSTQEHVDTLRRRGALILGPEEGRLASGEVGVGRMVEPETIVAAIVGSAARESGSATAGAAPDPGSLDGRHVLVSAGPTYEPLDPVRFLGNRSSGRMGFALAAEAARRGARVTLVAGPVHLATPPGVDRIDVTTAREMESAVYGAAPHCDLAILAAAVADFRPATEAGRKIKKDEGGPLVLELVTNPDILAGLPEVAPDAVRVGFAAETHDLDANARSKLERKRVHFLVANDVSRQDIGFGSAENEVCVYRRSGDPVRLGKRSKESLAGDLLDLFAAALADPARTGER